jgi:C-terminal processing protease CtpA/Prc
MNSRLIKIGLCALGLAAPLLEAKHAPKTDEEEVVKMDPVVVEASSLASAGFKFKARFRHNLVGTGIRELVIVEVGPQSAAKRAGLSVGEKILQIRDVKVEGLGLKELQEEFASKAVNGKVTLLIEAKGSTETRTVDLQFSNPHTAPEPSKAAPPSSR